MSWVISPRYRDPYYSSVSLLLHGDGADEANTSADFVVNSQSPKTITLNGDAKIRKSPTLATPDPFGRTDKGVMAFDGTGDYLSLAASNDFAFGTGDFTIEGWVYPTNAVLRGVFHIGATLLPAALTNSIALGISVNRWEIYINNNNNAGFSTFSAPTVVTNTWYHFALCKNNNVSKLFINGSQVLSLPDTFNYTCNVLAVGAFYSSAYTIAGYIDDFRVTKGIGRYESGFPLPTAPFPDI